jgi:hypothetical protein
VKFIAAIGASLIAITALAGARDIHRVDGAVSVDCAHAGDNIATVDGPISIEDHCSVGTVKTVDGSIKLGAYARAESLRSVDGELTLGEGSQVARDAKTVDGTILLRPSAEVTGAVASIDGRIQLLAAHVGGGISTVDGDIDVGHDSHVEGGILVDRIHSSGGHSHPPIVTIGPGATVEGTLRFRQPVKLYVSDKARIGPVEGSQPIPFSGDRP